LVQCSLVQVTYKSRAVLSFLFTQCRLYFLTIKATTIVITIRRRNVTELAATAGASAVDEEEKDEGVDIGTPPEIYILVHGLL